MRQTLRRATAAAHHALDHHPLMQRLTGNHLTRAFYTESLAAMYRPHVQLERLVHESGHRLESGLDLSARRESLEADLRELGWPVAVVARTTPTSVETRAVWWGRVYVLEGSRQGAAVIARCIHASLGDTVPCRFFKQTTRHGDHAAMLAILERELLAPDDLAQAAASAQAAFASYTAELDAFSDCGKG